ncbi:hypothetical protein K7X08_037343 [Anisodus acutangulus]|uniref:DC1 domain-containing protein n=1 Tax=Anisodus acutangulus TaxID=402998 RepID=A0A9Q1RRX8_9SOLA|nr:hypothetical protein K7X08_037343 [Anisodus acutangulus]
MYIGSKPLATHKEDATTLSRTGETKQKMNEDDKETDQEKVESKNRQRRMRQLLRAAFDDANSDHHRPCCEGTLNHFSHRHPLERFHLRESEGIKCNFCDVIISGLCFSCKDCDYYLHDMYCSNFPKEISHDFHPGSDHTLVLRPFKAATGREQFSCSACGDDDSDDHLFQSYYFCELCNFNLHVECASIPIILNLKVKYPLHLFLSFPRTSEAADPFCPICAKAIPNSGCWVFYNHDHDYPCHFGCAAVSEYGVENDSMSKLQIRLQNLAITNRPHARTSHPIGEVFVTHFSHRHPLKEYNSAKPLRCNLCNFESSTGYVCCSGCNYFIDEICFAIPSKIQHMSHPQHPLKLTCYLDFVNENLECLGCFADFRRGRAYYCAPCKFIINRQCAAAPKTLTLPDNVAYELFVSFPFKHEMAEIKCNICSQKVVAKDRLLYYNLERDETLHVFCAIRKESGDDVAREVGLSLQRLNEVKIVD